MSPYYADESVTLWHGDALAVLSTMPDASVDCCVTSPPYFGLRDYGEAGQYGLESSPTEYVETMRAVFAEVRRVLADDGTLWLNIGDSYVGSANSGGASKRIDSRGYEAGPSARVAGLPAKGGLPAKNLLGIPWRTAFALQDDAIREESDPGQQSHNERYAKVYAAQADRASTTGQPGNVNSAGIHSRPGKPGRNARSVWSISAQPFAEAHFATMPSPLAERAILAGCKPGGTVLDPVVWITVRTFVAVVTSGGT